MVEGTKTVGTATHFAIPFITNKIANAISDRINSSGNPLFSATNASKMTRKQCMFTCLHHCLEESCINECIWPIRYNKWQFITIFAILVNNSQSKLCARIMGGAAKTVSSCNQFLHQWQCVQFSIFIQPIYQLYSEELPVMLRSESEECAWPQLHLGVNRDVYLIPFVGLWGRRLPLGSGYDLLLYSALGTFSITHYNSAGFFFSAHLQACLWGNRVTITFQESTW